MCADISRRTLIGSGFAAGLSVPFAKFLRAEDLGGQFQSPNSGLGHKLVTRSFPEPTDTIKKDVVIIGTGISGLSAARQLKKLGVKNIALLELEEKIGGNARGGKNKHTNFPWAAHYVPLLDPSIKALVEFFEEEGIIVGFDAGKPIYNEEYLCHAPEDRLYFYGTWQDSLIPQSGIPESDRKQIAGFFKFVEDLKYRKGKDGRFAFAVPVDESSTDREFRGLDYINMSGFMHKYSWVSEYLNWYVNYCCRDDYGTTHDKTSAWAGLHYFASRRESAANAKDGSVLTWPEGNQFLSSRLWEQAKDACELNTGCIAFKVEQDSAGVRVFYYDRHREKSYIIVAKALMCCVPQFVASKLIDRPNLPSFSYAPWAVANTVISNLPNEGSIPLSWDNVSYHGNSLGYVFANHQDLKVYTPEYTLTQYWPLTDYEPEQARALSGMMSLSDWQSRFKRELLHMHPSLENKIKSIDVCLWGHGMIRPTTNFMWSKERIDAAKPVGRVYFAHSDLSGISIFEEAFLRGRSVATELRKDLQRRGELS